ncbi:MAG: hypothetical protein ACKO0M_14330 [Cyanobium sp.]
MADTPYLVAVALVEIGGRRALPLGGQSWPAAAGAVDPGDLGRTLALELLLRLWQRSDGGALQRAAADTSLLLLEMPLDTMSEQLPRLKAAWLGGGGTDTLHSELKALAARGWTVNVAKFDGVQFTPWG